MASEPHRGGYSARLPKPPPDLTGRERELATLLDRVDAFPALLVLGLPGSGKSALLAALAQKLAAARQVRWLDLRELAAGRLLAELEAARASGSILFADGLEARSAEAQTALARVASFPGRFTTLVAAASETPRLGPIELLSLFELRLGPLEAASGLALFESLAGERPCRLEMAGGHPQAIRLLAASARAAGPGEDPAGLFRTALGRSALGTRLSELQPAARRALEALAVVEDGDGPGADAALLEAAAGPGAPLAELGRQLLITVDGASVTLGEPVRGLALASLSTSERRAWELELGRQREARGEWARAHDRYCRAAAAAPARAALGRLWQELGRLGRHGELLERAERTAALEPSVEVSCMRARAMASLGQPREALNFLRQERDRFGAEGGGPDKVAQARLLACQAEVHWQLGEEPRALRAAWDALQRGEETGDTRATIDSLELLGLLHSARGDATRAVSLLERARSIAGGDESARSMAVRAAVEARAGRFESAAGLYRLAIETTASTSEKAQLTRELAACLASSGDTAAALDLARWSRALASSAADRDCLIASLGLIGRLERDCGSLEAALESLGRALTLGGERAPDGAYVEALLDRGEILRTRGDLRGAARDFARALGVASTLADAALPVRALTLLGALAAERGEYSRAAEHYRQAMERVRAGAPGVAMVDVLCGLAAVSRDRGEYASAAQLLEQAQRAASELAPGARPAALRCARARVLLQKTALARARGDQRAALEHATAASELAREAGDRLLAPRIALEMAGVFRENGEYPKAMEVLWRVFDSARATGDRLAAATSLEELARCHQERGDYARAARLFRRGLLLAQRIDALRMVARFINALAHIEADRGAHREALALYKRARVLLRGLHDRKETQKTLGGIADLHRNRRELPQALQAARDALRIAEELPDPPGAARALSQISTIQAQMGKPTEALHTQRQSLAIREGLGDVRGIVESLTRSSRIYSAMRDPDRAEPLIERALGIAREYALGRAESLLLAERAGIELERANLSEAESLAAAAADLAAGLDFAEGLARAYRVVGLVQKKLHRYDVSQRYLERALKCFRRLRRDAEIETLVDEIKSVGRENLDALLEMRRAMVDEAAELEREIADRHGQDAALLLAELAAFPELLRERGVESAMDHAAREDALIVPRILAGGGTVLVCAGDRYLARFDTAAQALAASISIHRDNCSGAGPLPEVRMGLHHGRIAVTGGRVAGRAVEVLGRLPSLAGPDGIAVTAELLAHLESSAPLALEEIQGVRARSGESPLRVYRVTPAAREAP
ncbi:MAG: tetratricopeptide repeat protein [Candidatus Wallbacteria bacterium]|nr:tetratricopeptide repeat protein [Candidatus Wallbacteria bacterium]